LLERRQQTIGGDKIGLGQLNAWLPTSLKSLQPAAVGSARVRRDCELLASLLLIDQDPFDRRLVIHA
jgi:hypothetical protein